MVTIEERSVRRKDNIKSYLDKYYNVESDIEDSLAKGLISKREYENYKIQNDMIQRQIKEGIIEKPDSQEEMTLRKINNFLEDLSQEEIIVFYRNYRENIAKMFQQEDDTESVRK